MDLGRIRATAQRIAFRFSRPGSVRLPGVNRSILRGHGLSFVGYREYQHGDDIRLVDWNVTARYARPVVKVFEQEHASAFMLVIDASASMRIPDSDKWVLASELAALFAFIAARDAESIGGLVVTARVEDERPPRQGLAHANALAQWLHTIQPAGDETALDVGIHRAMRVLRRPGVIVVASDFLSGQWDTALQQAARRHTVIALAVSSPREHELPDAGLVRVRDAESGEICWVDTRSPAARRAFAARAAEVRRAVRARLLDAGAVPVEVRTDQPYLRVLRGICRPRGSL